MNIKENNAGQEDIDVVLTVADKREQFKRECKSNKYRTIAILDCNDRIEEIDVILTGLTCPNGNREPKRENAKDPYKNKKVEFMLIQDKIIAEKKEHIEKINYVNRMLSCINDPLDRQMIVDLYIDKKNQQQVADKYNYSSRSALIKHVNGVIDKLFKESTL